MLTAKLHMNFPANLFGLIPWPSGIIKLVVGLPASIPVLAVAVRAMYGKNSATLRSKLAAGRDFKQLLGPMAYMSRDGSS